eukprot:TRINITY_DN13439_c0_g1_i1.p1 TRINITY_DN13439_c0_g1~~TRINITY_DN13439_c0_g1_i1.p1  ORF type:complete len:876 (+),score=127.69 TRINITY_DN13439_c0_g1_i1:102-2630(+)
MVASASPLTPSTYKVLPVGSITPKGWLLKQLKLQADGLTGHLAQFWNDVMQSVWIGGGGDGGLHERTPYWLNGIVPLAFLLKNAGIDELDPVLGIYKAPWGRSFDPEAPVCVTGTVMFGEDIAGPAGYSVESELQCRDDCQARGDCYGFVVDNCQSPMTCWLKGGNGATSGADCRCYAKNVPKPVPVNPMAQVEQYISYILSHQDPETGWLGPQMSGGDQYWGPSNALFALLSYAEGNRGDSDKFNNATQAVLLHLLEQKRRMSTEPLTSWAADRWMDIALSAEWLIDNGVAGEHEQDLLDLIGLLRKQGNDWEQWFEHWTGDRGVRYSHNVNNAQAFKSAAVYYRYNSSFTYEGHTLPELSKRRMQNMDAKYGLPTGMFNGDELFPEPGYERHPSRGIELCGVVEHMFSYNTMFAIHGEPAFADRAERIAYNALPATWASPTGGDMWAHQYLQAINEINAIKAAPSIWTHDNEFSETYGLEPNFGCCTANYHQGWPKFANMLVYATQDNGAAVALYAPARVNLPDGTVVDIDTAYPFEDAATVAVIASKDVPVYLRIPNWATAATVNGIAAANGTMWRGDAKQGETKFVIEFNPKVRLEEWDNGAVSVHRGQLMYALPITPKYTVYAHHYGTDTMSNDYYLNPQTPWQFALDVDPRAVEETIIFQSTELLDYSQAGVAPFNHSGWPTTLAANVRSLPSWGEDKNSAARPPTSPACQATQSIGCVAGLNHKFDDLPNVPLSGLDAAECEAKCKDTDGCQGYVVIQPGCEGNDVLLCFLKSQSEATSHGESCSCMGSLPPPQECGPTEQTTLVPFGGTELRIGEFPLASFAGASVVTQVHLVI